MENAPKTNGRQEDNPSQHNVNDEGDSPTQKWPGRIYTAELKAPGKRSSFLIEGESGKNWKKGDTCCCHVSMVANKTNKPQTDQNCPQL